MSTMTANQRRVLDALAASREDDSSGLIKKVGVGIAVLAFVALLILWLMGFFSTSKEVLEIRGMVDAQIAELDRVARNEVPMSYDGASFGAMFDKMRNMPEKTREQVRGEMDRLFRARERAELQSYFALPADKRLAELDRRIKAEEARRKAWQEQRASRGGQGGNGGGRGNATAGGGGQRGGPGGGGPPRGGGGPGGSRGSEDGRNARAKQRIDSSTGEQRAQSTEYRRAMEERRQQLGLSPGRGR